MPAGEGTASGAGLAGRETSRNAASRPGRSRRKCRRPRRGRRAGAAGRPRKEWLYIPALLLLGLVALIQLPRRRAAAAGAAA